MCAGEDSTLKKFQTYLKKSGRTCLHEFDHKNFNLLPIL